MTAERLLAEANVLKQDFAILMRVSRVTVHHWLRGAHEPSRVHAGRYKSLLETIQTAVDTGLLPGLLARDMPRERRVNYVRQQLAEARRQSKAS